MAKGADKMIGVLLKGHDYKYEVAELIKLANLKQGDVLVVGCSSSEVIGEKIGTNSSAQTANELFGAIYEVCNQSGIYLAAQCCEHLNRALIIEKQLADKKGYEEVNVVPMPKAGGSFATAAYSAFENPVAVECIKADAGLDIGATLIGMHLKSVAVPVRLSIKTIGEAQVTAARVRPKFIGGIRANYDESKM